MTSLPAPSHVSSHDIRPGRKIRLDPLTPRLSGTPATDRGDEDALILSSAVTSEGRLFQESRRKPVKTECGVFSRGPAFGVERIKTPTPKLPKE